MTCLKREVERGREKVGEYLRGVFTLRRCVRIHQAGIVHAVIDPEDVAHLLFTYVS